MKDYPDLVGLVLLSLALLISLCLNVILCIRQRATFCRDADECCCTHTYTGESSSHDEERYLHNLSDNEQPENTHNHHEQEENPIYGNISSDRGDSGEVCYEMMTMQRTRDHMKSSDTDLNYASLDLKMAKKRVKKNRHQDGGHAQRRSKLQDELPVHLTPPVNAFFEVEADTDAHLPPRDSSTMVSHSSIYLNSQQIAQETEEMEREWGLNMEQESGAWEGIKRRDDRRSREWKGEQEGEERKDGSNGSVCTQLLEALQSDAFHQHL